MPRTRSQEMARDIEIHWNPNQPEPQPAQGTVTIQTGERIRRPPNAYLIFAKQRRRELRMDLGMGIRMQAITSRMSAEWRAMNPVQKEPYFAVQKRLQREHQEKYPGYVYTPTFVKKGNKAPKEHQESSKNNH